MTGREAVGYVIEIDNGEVILNLLDKHRGQLAAHSQGVSLVTEIESLLAISSGFKLLVMRVQSLSFAEPREAHRVAISNQLSNEPLRYLKGVIVGYLSRENTDINFTSDSLSTPALGAEAFPLTTLELGAISGSSYNHAIPITLGTNLRGDGPVIVNLSDLITRHVAVLGASGNGKSSFNTAVLQQIVSLPRAHVVIFDMNGEYEQAIAPYLNPNELLVTKIGGSNGYKIPYYALGREGLHRLLLPSEKTQKPALSFAIENLNKVKSFAEAEGIALADGAQPCLFDDCRAFGADLAHQAINRLRNDNVPIALNWPHMSALSALVAESYCIAQSNRGVERSGFNYSNVAPLVNRIRRLIEDEFFRDVVDVAGGATVAGHRLSWSNESQLLVKRFFGDTQSPWKVHVINLRSVAQDLMPMVLGSLLELYASELFRRGQGNSPETLLLLEEAHHYLRPVGTGDEAKDNALAYERLAKEGRKFGLALWISTQRPSEVSPTVLSQCGTWACFRLTTEQDLNSVTNATEWVDRREVRRIAGLAKRQAIVFGSGVIMPTLIRSHEAAPPPMSSDPAFDSWATPKDNP